MGIESPLHLLFLGAIALIVLGPKRLPELARALGKGIREFRAAFDEAAAPADQDSPLVEHDQPGKELALAAAPAVAASEQSETVRQEGPDAGTESPG